MKIISDWKKDFPLFSSTAHQDLHYFDSAATCLVPKIVAECSYHYLTQEHANSHRGIYQLSNNATVKVEQTREKIKDFIKAHYPKEIIFCSGTTEAINIIAKGFIKPKINANHNIIISQAEHHANFLPWQMLCQQTGAELRVIRLNKNHVIDIDHLSSSIDTNTLLIAVNHISNVLGTTNPVKEICNIAKKNNVPVLIDGAQAIGHYDINVSDIGCDFYAFSGHKMYAGNSCGILYINKSHHDSFIPVTLGGGIVDKVTNEETRYVKSIQKLEAGTLNTGGIMCLSAAISYLNNIDKKEIKQYLNQVSTYLLNQLSQLSFIKLISPNDETASIIAFMMNGVHSHDVASILDSNNIAVRVGHHCAQPLHQYLGIKNSIRVSLGIYSQQEDIDELVSTLVSCHEMLSTDIFHE